MWKSKKNWLYTSSIIVALVGGTVGYSNVNAAGIGGGNNPEGVGGGSQSGELTIPGDSSSSSSASSSSSSASSSSSSASSSSSSASSSSSSASSSSSSTGGIGSTPIVAKPAETGTPSNIKVGSLPDTGDKAGVGITAIAEGAALVALALGGLAFRKRRNRK